MKLNSELIQKYDVPGPRYTSYPTYPAWNQNFSEALYRQKLAEFGSSANTLSLYVHLPFCESLCRFCACNMLVRSDIETSGNRYLDYVEKELALLRNAIGRKATLRQLHWGGGTPNYLLPHQLKRLAHAILEQFEIDREGEMAIEVDPVQMTEEKAEVLSLLGFNRVSMGLQDFDPQVQTHVNRLQPYAVTQDTFNWFRSRGISSINVDLIYGLPFQSISTFSHTIDQVIELGPDRIALYSFAFVPWAKKHQKTLDQNVMPSPSEKIEIFLMARDKLLSAGFEAIAMDHFARATDEMAIAAQNGKLHRNFMGYTLKSADEYLGIGVSSIGFLEESFVQNHKSLSAYYRDLENASLPIERGLELSQDDLIRKWVIGTLMCQFEIDKNEFGRRFDLEFDEYFAAEKNHLEKCLRDGLTFADNQKITATALGRLFIRNICMGFDWYLHTQKGAAQFSRTV